MRTRILAALVAALASPTPLLAQGAEAEVIAVVNGVFDGMRKVDSAMVRPLFHAKARMITMDLRSERPARVEESVEGFIKSVGSPRTELYDEQLSNVKTLIDGSLASVWAGLQVLSRNNTPSLRRRSLPAREGKRDVEDH
jgi:hypothetical protein